MSSTATRSTVSLAMSLLQRRDRARLLVCLLLIVLGSVTDLLSVGLVIPVVGAVVEGDIRGETRWLPDWLNTLSFDSFVIVLMALLVGSFVVKNTFQVVSNYYQQRAQLSISNRLIQRMFESYIRQPYEFHLTHSSSVLLRNIQEYSTAVMTQAIAPALVLTAETLSGVGYIVVLLLIEPLGTLILLATFGLATLLISRMTKKTTASWGAQRIIERGRQTEALLSGFGGIKEIKLFGRDGEFVTAHQISLYAAGRFIYRFGLLQSLPRAIFEVLTVASVAVIISLTIMRGDSLQSATVVLALFGVAAFRLLPSINRVLSALQLFSFGRAGVAGAVQSFNLAQPVKSRVIVKSNERFKRLEVEGLRYAYPNTEQFVVDIESLVIHSGESVGIIGTSGSGKSTLMDLLIGVLTPTEGRILINDRDLEQASREWMDQIGYVPQSVYLLDSTIRQNVAFGLPPESIDGLAIQVALETANLWDFVSSLPSGLETVVGERGIRLSGGQRQRLGIARALYQQPEVLALDEATSALDDDTEREIVRSFEVLSRDRTTFVVAHRVSTLRHCSRILRLENGRIIADGSFVDVIGSIQDSEGQ